jgi:hypothetical protein
MLGAVRTSTWAVRAATVAIVTGGVAAVGVSLTGFVLADIYRPRSGGAVPGIVSADVRRSNSWSDWHQRTSLVFLAATLVTSALDVGMLLRGERPVARRAVVAGSLLAAVVSALVTSLTRGMVEWDQLGLRAVTVGTDMSGYRTAAFDDRVRFVLMGGSEVSQGQYAVALLVHLGAPVLGTLTLAIVAWTLRRAARAAWC